MARQPIERQEKGYLKEGTWVFAESETPIDDLSAISLPGLPVIDGSALFTSRRAQSCESPRVARKQRDIPRRFVLSSDCLQRRRGERWWNTIAINFSLPVAPISPAINEKFHAYVARYLLLPSRG